MFACFFEINAHSLLRKMELNQFSLFAYLPFLLLIYITPFRVKKFPSEESQIFFDKLFISLMEGFFNILLGR